MSFYHDEKEYMSPSAISQWMNGRSQFIRTYFAGEKSPTTSAMRGGTEIHALIEAGLIKARHVYAYSEIEVKVQVPGTEFWFLGRPDSHSKKTTLDGKKVAYFVDYKSGKANGWDEKLPTDIKMRATAWLVWMAAGQPDLVYGYIEFIQTTWDPEQKKVVPLEGKETEVTGITYTADEMEAFSKVIANTMRDVNDYYEKWKLSTGEFVNPSDVARYAQVKNEIAIKEEELNDIAERILIQMEFGGEEQHKTPLGTFYITEKSVYEYPADLAVTPTMTLDAVDQLTAVAKAAKKNYELSNEPKEVKRSIGFRAPKAT